MVRNTRLMARFPIAANIRLIHKGQIVARKDGGDFEFTPTEPGPYRLEAWLKVDGEERPWIYSNPIYLAAPEPADLALPPTSLSENVKAVGDVPYTVGKPQDADKHQLDLYLPAGTKNFPVLFFVYGGSWRSGDRRQYAALGNRFAKQGIGVVVPSYRLAPANPPPAQIDDVSAAFAWTAKYIEKYGGDPKRIFVAGHSAGGQLAALLALNPQYLAGHSLKPGAIRGVIGISGAYDVRNLPVFGPAEGKAESPLEHADHSAPPFLIAYAQWDYPYLPRQARALDAALRSHFTPSTLKFISRENHISEIVNIWKDDDPLAQAIIGFVRSAN
jgi:acetyl esterase/lipase